METQASVHQLLFDLEQRLLQPEVRRSRDELTALLAEEFVEFASSGRVFDRPSIIAALSVETRFEASITDFRAVSLAQDTVLVTYRVAVSVDERLPARQALPRVGRDPGSSLCWLRLPPNEARGHRMNHPPNATTQVAGSCLRLSQP